MWGFAPYPILAGRQAGILKCPQTKGWNVYGCQGSPAPPPMNEQKPLALDIPDCGALISNIYKLRERRI